MSRMDYLLAIAVLSMGVLIVAGIPCSDPESDECLRVLDSFIYTNLTLPLVRLMSAATLDAMCGYPTETFLECSTVFKDCTEEKTAAFLTSRSTIQFLCSDAGRDGWKGSVQCVAGGEQLLVTWQCLSTFSQLTDLLSPLNNGERYRCSVLRQFVQCAETATEELCGREATLWHQQLLMHMLMPRAELARCTLGHMPMGMVIAIIMGVVSVGAGILVVAAYFYNRRLQAVKKRRYADREGIFSSVPEEGAKYQTRHGF